MSFEDALRPTSGGTIIDFDVTPGARETRVPSGYNEWRRRIEAKLRAPPEKGRANEELLKALSGLFDVPGSRISIVSGATDSKKSVKVSGLAREDAIKTLRGRI
jgi:uncharacterized protein